MAADFKVRANRGGGGYVLSVSNNACTTGGGGRRGTGGGSVECVCELQELSGVDLCASPGDLGPGTVAEVLADWGIRDAECFLTLLSLRELKQKGSGWR